MAKTLDPRTARFVADIRDITRETESASSRNRRKPKQRPNGWVSTLIVLLLVIVLAVFGFGMRSDVDLQQDSYCKNVAAGIWPDYEGTFRESCGGKTAPKFTQI
jgi:hypothetical protein